MSQIAMNQGARAVYNNSIVISYKKKTYNALYVDEKYGYYVSPINDIENTIGFWIPFGSFQIMEN